MVEREMSWAEVAPHLVGLAHLATADDGGNPSVAVVSPLVDGEVVWIQTRRASTKARNVVARGAVALMWQGDGEAYVWGEAEVDDSIDEKAARWSSWGYDASGFFGTPESPDVVLLRVKPLRATVLRGGADGPERCRWVDDAAG